jgi:hypothetical protein
MMFRLITQLLCVLILCLAAVVAHAQSIQLLMLERHDCPWCRAWHREIGPGYPHSDEGKRAPLRRVDLAEAWPADLPKLAAYYTPTFLLLVCNREIGRLVGYQGPDFFYPALAQLLVPLKSEAASCG